MYIFFQMINGCAHIMLRSKCYFSFHSDLTDYLGRACFPLISLLKYSSEIGGVHHVRDKSECAGHIRHRKETRGLSVGSDRVDTRKIPGMLRKHGFPGLQTEEEGNKSIHGAWKPIYQLSHTHTHTGGIKPQQQSVPDQYKPFSESTSTTQRQQIQHTWLNKKLLMMTVRPHSNELNYHELWINPVSTTLTVILSLQKTTHCSFGRYHCQSLCLPAFSWAFCPVTPHVLHCVITFHWLSGLRYLSHRPEARKERPPTYFIQCKLTECRPGNPSCY